MTTLTTQEILGIIDGADIKPSVVLLDYVSSVIHPSCDPETFKEGIKVLQEYAKNTPDSLPEKQPSFSIDTDDTSLYPTRHLNITVLKKRDKS